MGDGDSVTAARSTPVRIGILGSSWWADSMYLPALAQHPHGRVTAIAGRDAATLAQRWDAPHSFARYEDLIHSGLVDAVIVATRNDQHCPLTLAALDQGLHVLCEKPLGLTYAEAAQMAARAASAGAPSA